MLISPVLSPSRPVFLPDPVNRSHPLNDGRIAWWLSLPGWEGGNRWFDLMGLNHGTLTSMTTAGTGWAPTTRPGGWEHVLFGNGTHVVTPMAATLGSFAVAAWFLSTGVGNADRILDKNYASGFWLGRNGGSANSWGGGIQEAGAPYGTYVTLPDRQWHRIMMMRVGTQKYLFGDGGVVSVASTVAATAMDTVPIWMGTTGGGVNGFTGSIDDVSIWSASPLATSNPAGFAAMDYDLSRRGYPGVLNRY